MLKWAGFLQLNDTAVTLFTDEYKLHLPGGPYPFPAPTVMAFLSGSAEIIFPILLVLDFGTRFAATGLLFMTLIVELAVPDGWPFASPGRDGARHHGLGTGSPIRRLPHPPFS